MNLSSWKKSLFASKRECLTDESQSTLGVAVRHLPPVWAIWMSYFFLRKKQQLEMTWTVVHEAVASNNCFGVQFQSALAPRSAPLESMLASTPNAPPSCTPPANSKKVPKNHHPASTAMGALIECGQMSKRFVAQRDHQLLCSSRCRQGPGLEVGGEANQTVICGDQQDVCLSFECQWTACTTASTSVELDINAGMGSSSGSRRMGDGAAYFMVEGKDLLLN
ncbi:hypothetical protein BDK51DRAFT_33311 [Blyttiomyces helicus]|uniref:Uncharacterized protein n=1 Tax=Blyttiomyces helicus TaxID=388810 RepID=A0A4P9WIR4_9FUNG|nr:hypothetical protein BDK51DRAFT_33311 [Blyttiomyces helicus]|eukprot:RKO91338.1 hypothetical protein BDK51DRAFT_33311 [Blyttiomyces helicus]